MKFVAIVNRKAKKDEDRIISYITDDCGPIPPVIRPEDEDEEKDTEPPKPEPGERPS